MMPRGGRWGHNGWSVDGYIIHRRMSIGAYETRWSLIFAVVVVVRHTCGGMERIIGITYWHDSTGFF